MPGEDDARIHIFCFFCVRVYLHAYVCSRVIECECVRAAFACVSCVLIDYCMYNVQFTLKMVNCFDPMIDYHCFVSNSRSAVKEGMETHSKPENRLAWYVEFSKKKL